MIMEFWWWPPSSELRYWQRQGSGPLAGEQDGRGGDGPARGLGEGWHAQVHGGGLPGGQFVHLGDLGGRGGEADFESLGFPGPVVLLSLGDSVAQVVADAGQARPLGWVGPQEGAADVPLTEPVESSPVLLPRSTDSDSSAGPEPVRPRQSLRVAV